MSVGAAELVDALRAAGLHRATGVPCGHLAGPWELYDRAGDLVPAPDEGAALAIAAGWELGGTSGVVLCQNSGFGNLVNPLTSLVLACRIPVTVLMSLRGWPDPATDEQQHEVMGVATPALLRTLGVPYAVLAGGAARPGVGVDVATLLAEAEAARADGLPFVGLVPRGAIGKLDAGAVAAPAGDGPTRATAVAELMDRIGDAFLVTTTGYLSRQAHHERDRDRTFYMQGSMGHAAAIGLGLAQAHPDERVVVLDGDGALLMHLGTGAAIGSLAVANLVHVVVDNGCYESTGAQRTTSTHLDWTALGRSLGYRCVRVADSAAALPDALDAAFAASGPVLCVLRVVPTPGDVHPRASSGSGLPQLTERFRAAGRGVVHAAEGASP
ncbi:thiamine pyrophosphate-dependent enzyme [Actinomycetes bacterium KLBMP 9759]